MFVYACSVLYYVLRLVAWHKYTHRLLVAPVGRESNTLYTSYTLYTLYTLYIIHTKERERSAPKREKEKFGAPKRKRGKVGKLFCDRILLGNQTARKHTRTKRNEMKRNAFLFGLTPQNLWLLTRGLLGIKNMNKKVLGGLESQNSKNTSRQIEHPIWITDKPN